MAVKAINFKLGDERINEIKKVANVFRITMTDVVNEALDAYLEEKKKDPFYRLTCNVEDICENEGEEILNALNSMSDDDLKIASVKRCTV